MDLGPSPPSRFDQTGCFQNVQMPRNCLARETLSVLCDGHRTHFEKRLFGTAVQATNDPPTRWIGKCLEYAIELIIAHS